MTCPIAFPALALAAAIGTPKVAPVSLADLSLYADAIVVGQVARVVCVGKDGEIVSANLSLNGTAWCRDDRTIAEVAVERVLRGDPATRRVWFFAQSTWTCDVTHAAPGERALFFLTQSGDRAAEEKQHQAEMEVTGGHPVLRDAWSGRGRMPITIEGGSELITAWRDVRPPDELSCQPAHDIPYASVYWRARLEDVARLVEVHISSTFQPVPAHPVSGLPACMALIAEGNLTVAAFWRDGTAVWSADPLAGGPPYLQGDTAAASVAAIGRMWKESASESDLSPRDAILGFPRSRVTLRFIGAFQELALHAEGAQPKYVAQLREQILGAVPDEGVRPLVQPLVMR